MKTNVVTPVVQTPPLEYTITLTEAEASELYNFLEYATRRDTWVMRGASSLSLDRTVDKTSVLPDLTVFLEQAFPRA